MTCEPQGRSSSKEQIGWLYDASKVTVNKIMDWPDLDDWYERPPCVVEFFVVQAEASVKKFIVVGIHITPGDVTKELNHLYDTHDAVAKEFGYDVSIIRSVTRLTVIRPTRCSSCGF